MANTVHVIVEINYPFKISWQRKIWVQASDIKFHVFGVLSYCMTHDYFNYETRNRSSTAVVVHGQLLLNPAKPVSVVRKAFHAVDTTLRAIQKYSAHHLNFVLLLNFPWFFFLGEINHMSPTGFPVGQFTTRQQLDVVKTNLRRAVAFVKLITWFFDMNIELYLNRNMI